jgi:chromosome segregation ATPase
MTWKEVLNAIKRPRNPQRELEEQEVAFQNFLGKFDRGINRAKEGKDGAKKELQELRMRIGSWVDTINIARKKVNLPELNQQQMIKKGMEERAVIKKVRKTMPKVGAVMKPLSGENIRRMRERIEKEKFKATGPVNILALRKKQKRRGH